MLQRTTHCNHKMRYSLNIVILIWLLFFHITYRHVDYDSIEEDINIIREYHIHQSKCNIIVTIFLGIALCRYLIWSYNYMGQYNNTHVFFQLSILMVQSGVHQPKHETRNKTHSHKLALRKQPQPNFKHLEQLSIMVIHFYFQNR